MVDASMAEESEKGSNREEAGKRNLKEGETHGGSSNDKSSIYQTECSGSVVGVCCAWEKSSRDKAIGGKEGGRSA